MPLYDRWDLLLWALAALVAVAALARLMLRHRDVTMLAVRGEIEAERARERQAQRSAAQARPPGPGNRGA